LRERFRKTCWFFALSAMLAVNSPVHAAAPLPAESGRAEYVIKRNGDPIGTLKIDFLRDGDRLVATSDYSLKIKLMAIVLYRYDKRMVETYENGRLVAYESDIDDNGKKSQVRVNRRGDALSIVHPKGTLTAPIGLYPSTYWPPATIDQTQMIDSSDGVLMNVKTVEAATGALTIDGRSVNAKHYRMSGAVERDLWYDSETGAWLKMKLEGSDGSVIEIERDWPPVWKRDLL
jgi:hypothetical protein